MPKVQMLWLIPLLSLPACVPFVGGPSIVTASSVGCSTLVDAWMKPVEGADLPGGDTVGDWIVYSDQQSGKLDTANDRIVNGHATVKACETRDALAVRRASKGWFGRLFD